MSLYKKLADTFNDIEHDIDVRFIQEQNNFKKIIFKSVVKVNGSKFSTIGVYPAKKDINTQLDDIKEDQLHEILDDFYSGSKKKPETEDLNEDSQDKTVDLNEYKENKKEENTSEDKKDNKEVLTEEDLDSEDYNAWTTKSLKVFEHKIKKLAKIRKDNNMKKSQLNPYVDEFSNGQLTEISEITPLYIDGFIEFLETKLAQDLKASG